MRWIEGLKQEWFKRNEARLLLEYAPQLDALEERLSSRKSSLENELNLIQSKFEEDIQHFTQRVEDRKLDLIRCNEDLKNQIRLIESKASPSNVWAEAFSAGFSKAWDCIWPLLQEGVLKSKEFIRNQAIDEARSNIEAAVLSRLEQAQQFDLKPVASIQTELFRLKGLLARNPAYKDSIQALEWVLKLKENGS